VTWTYDATILSTATTASDRMKVRLLIGDTDTSRQQLQDEEVDFILSVQTVVTYAAADCADLLAAKYAFQVNTENSLLRISAAARHKHYADLAKRLRANGPGETPGGEGAGSILATGYAGGISDTANQTLRDNDDNILPPVAVGQDDFPEATDDPATYFQD
jgi:hypothetical protein